MRSTKKKKAAPRKAAASKKATPAAAKKAAAGKKATPAAARAAAKGKPKPTRDVAFVDGGLSGELPCLLRSCPCDAAGCYQKDAWCTVSCTVSCAHFKLRGMAGGTVPLLPDALS
jgi:hypothetical protein